jgi:excisionase family DNA binding protein
MDSQTGEQKSQAANTDVTTLPVEPLPRLLYTVPETARILGISRSKTYQLISDGRLGSVLIDGCRRVPATAIYKFMEQLEGMADP